jgi:hypothetical protein
MNIPTLKAFAPAVRRQIIEAVTLKLNHALTARTPDYLDTYARQVAALRTLEQEDRAGLIERVAYTWFNRLTALRFLDARGWHPFGARVLTPATPDETQPELLKLVRAGHCPEELQRHTILDRLNGLLDGGIPSNDPQGEVYRHLVLAACRFYNALLPDLFERLDDETELLLPDDLLTEHSIVQGFRSEITDEDCSEVEMLGWLYQFYISEKKDQVMARKAAVPTADIPAVTQLFTPHWIVRYLVENSLGRLWLLNRPDSLLRAWMPYYIEGEPETDFLRIARPEDIRLCDPAVGSGHMLTYAFDLLFVIYEEEGYAPNEIPALILRHNLHGLDICPRAAQLAEMALVFKAREKSSQFFRPDNLVQPRILALQDVHFAESELHGYIETLRLGELFDGPMLRLLHQFEEATTFGSLIQPCLDEQQIAFARGFIEVKDLAGHLFLHETHKKVLRVLEQAEMLTPRYHVVVVNPPYMGSGGMNAPLAQWAKSNYPDSKADTFAMFMERGLELNVQKAYMGMINLPSWLFLSSFESVRRKMLAASSIDSMLHMGRGIFGIDWGSIAFIVRKTPQLETAAQFFRLHKRNFQYLDYEDIGKLFLRAKSNHAYRFNFDEYRNEVGQNDIPESSNPSGLQIYYCAFPSNFSHVPGSPIAYWLKNLDNFSSRKIGDVFVSGGRNKTHDNVKYLRFFWEVNRDQTRWVVYSNGGDFRKYYGNDISVVDWSVKARSFYESQGGLCNQVFWGKEGITWSLVTSVNPSFRIKLSNAMYSSGAPTIFSNDFTCDLIALAFLNSAVSLYYLKALNPTVNTTVNDVFSLPFIPLSAEERASVEERSLCCLDQARIDWDYSETSRDFLSPAILSPKVKCATLELSWKAWELQRCNAIRSIQEMETANNRVFIKVYGLKDELNPEVPEEQITLAKPDARRDMAAVLSFAVSCMMGRYSLDRPGLILANAGDSIREYLDKVGRVPDQLTFAPDEDGIIPVLDGDWFEDDIVARTREFLRTTFGEATLRENIRFIEESLGKELRNYFLTDFYKDHLQTYKKRPIYWMIQSPRKGFSVLIYLHRYTRDTMNLVLNRYLREYQVKLRSRIAHLAEVQTSGAVNTRDKTAARKEFDKLTKTLHECEEWERQIVLPLAQARIELDLDDGVKVNYLKLGEALAPIPGLAAAED